MKTHLLSFLCISSITSVIAMESPSSPFEKTIIITFLQTCLKNGRSSEQVFPLYKQQLQVPLSDQEVREFHAHYKNAQDLYLFGRKQKKLRPRREPSCCNM